MYMYLLSKNTVYLRVMVTTDQAGVSRATPDSSLSSGRARIGKENHLWHDPLQGSSRSTYWLS